MVTIGDKISELPSLVIINGAENIPVQKGGKNYKIPSSIFKNIIAMGIKKSYNSVSAMQADGTAPVGNDGTPLKAGDLVSIWNPSNDKDPDNNSIYAFTNPGWKQQFKQFAVDADLDEQSSNAIENGVVAKYLSSGFLFQGIAAPATNPNESDSKIFYIAIDEGTYSNFGNLQVDEPSVLVYQNSTWSKEALGLASRKSVDTLSESKQDKLTFDETPTAQSKNPVTSGGVRQALDVQKAQVDAARDEALQAIDQNEQEAILNFNSQRVTPDMLSESTKQFIEASGGGTITNLADDEDIQSKENDLGVIVLKFADRRHDAVNFSGKGYKILRKNIQDGKNLLTQEMINEANTIYEVRYDFDLNSAEITIPEGCTLKFEGGNFRNGVLNGDNIKIVSELYKIFDIDISFRKNIISHIYPEWFGAKGDGITDDTLPIKHSINNLHNKGVLKLRNKTYSINGIDLTLNSNIGIEGDNDNTAPWVNQTVLLCNKNTDVFIKIVDTDYPDNQVPTIFGKSISIKNVFIDSNNKAMIGINMNYDIKLSDVYVMNCIQDGIVFEAQSYPLYLTRVNSSNNGRHGIYVKPRYTTCYYLLNVELSRNNGYGMCIEGGAACTLLNVLAQSNKAGGFKIKQIDAYDGKYKTFLSKLTFISCYTEANGTLSEQDELYDGNYSLKIEGLTSDLLFTNKIDYLSFIGCKFDNTFIEGTSNLLKLNSSFGNAIDYSKNIPCYLNNIRFDSIRIGGYNNPNLDTYYYKSNLTEVIQPSCFNDKSIIGTIQKDSSFLHIVGVQLQVNSYIKYTDRKENNTFFIFKCNKIKLTNNNNCQIIIGSCNVRNTDNNEVKEYNLKIDVYATDSIFISEKNTNRNITVNDLPLNAELYFNLTTFGILL